MIKDWLTMFFFLNSGGYKDAIKDWLTMFFLIVAGIKT